MKCPKCEKEIDQDSVFCEFCGCNVQEEVNKTVEEEHIIQKEKKTEVIKDKVNLIHKLTKKFDKKTLVAGAVALVAALGLVLYFTTRPKKIDLSTYLNSTPEVNGLNGAGYIDENDLFNSSLFRSDLLSSVQSGSSEDDFDNMTDEEIMSNVMASIEKEEELENAINEIEITYSYTVNGDEVSEISNLSNGDKVKITVKASPSTSKYFNREFVSSKIEIVVSGLKDGQTINPFDSQYFSLTYSGANGKATASAELSLGEQLDGFVYSCSIEGDKEYYSNGDEITATIVYDAEGMADFGYGLSATTKTFTVEGLGEYADGDSVISEDSLNRYIDLAKKSISYYNQACEYVATYLGYTTDDSDTPTLFVVFEGSSIFGKTTIYISYDELIVNDKNELSSPDYNEDDLPYPSTSYLSVSDTFTNHDTTVFKKMD